MMIAIDGPAGAGKSTVARGVASRLGFAYLDTGAMYRALTWLALEREVDPADGGALTQLAEDEGISLTPVDEVLRVEIAGRDVTAEIRGPGIAEHVSAVAAHSGVRAAMVTAQREITADGDWVADGRDVGTVVCPDAELKIYLVADVDVRAARRHLDLTAAGSPLGLAEVRAALLERDRIDTTREDSPLHAAEDAIVIDTSEMSIEEVVDDISLQAAARGAR